MKVKGSASSGGSKQVEKTHVLNSSESKRVKKTHDHVLVCHSSAPNSDCPYHMALVCGKGPPPLLVVVETVSTTLELIGLLFWRLIHTSISLVTSLLLYHQNRSSRTRRTRRKGGRKRRRTRSRKTMDLSLRPIKW
jgi:hypothetical protein